MAGKLTTVGAGLALDAAMGRATVTQRNVYLALLTAAPTVAATPGTVVEYAAAGYARQLCAMSVPSGIPRLSSNTAGLSFGSLTGANGTVAVTHWALMSTSSGTGGDVVAFGDWVPSRTPTASQTLTVAIGAVTVQLD